MAVALDAHSFAADFGGDDSFTQADHTCSGADRYLNVVAYGRSVTPSAATYNAISLTQVGTTQTTSFLNASLWELVAPATGTNTLRVDHSGANINGWFATSFTGVDQTTPNDGANEATGSGASPNNVGGAGDHVIATALDDLAVAWVVHADTNDGAMTPKSPATQIGAFEQTGNGNQHAFLAAGYIDDTGDVTLGWTHPSTDSWATFAVDLNAADGGGGTTHQAVAAGFEVVWGAAAPVRLRGVLTAGIDVALAAASATRLRTTEATGVGHSLAAAAATRLRIAAATGFIPQLAAASLSRIRTAAAVGVEAGLASGHAVTLTTMAAVGAGMDVAWGGAAPLRLRGVLATGVAPAWGALAAGVRRGAVATALLPDFAAASSGVMRGAVGAGIEVVLAYATAAVTEIGAGELLVLTAGIEPALRITAGQDPALGLTAGTDPALDINAGMEPRR